MLKYSTSGKKQKGINEIFLKLKGKKQSNKLSTKRKKKNLRKLF